MIPVLQVGKTYVARDKSLVKIIGMTSKGHFLGEFLKDTGDFVAKFLIDGTLVNTSECGIVSPIDKEYKPPKIHWFEMRIYRNLDTKEFVPECVKPHISRRTDPTAFPTTHKDWVCIKTYPVEYVEN